jgi:WD40 repeat protein
MANLPNYVGQQLGNYRLIRLLGEGGFAQVYLGEHVHLGTQAAVKVLHAQLTHGDVDAFRTEARTIAHLIHPHIVRVLDFGVEDKTPFLVMDYAPYGTLRHLHPKGSFFPLATIVTYIKQVADALQYAHDEKLIHRDIKPENMLVGERHEVLLSDFGIALVAQSSRHQSTQEVIGTVTYMSPEQIQGKPRPASDQYSLGIVVYEWLCGDRPFHGSFTELCTQHMFAPPPPLREKMPTISTDIEYVVMTALAKDPKQRFASIRAFATALEQASRLEPNRPPAPPKEVTAPIESSSSTILATPPHRTLEPTTQTPPPNLLSQEVASAHSKVQVPQLIRHPSRRTVIAGLVGLTLVGGGITWFAIPHSSTLGTTLYVYRGHSYEVASVAWSPDGKRIASGSSDSTVQVWNATDGSNVFTYQGHSNTVVSLAWSPDGKRIASSSYDKIVQIWDAVDGNNAFTYKGHSDGVNSVAWSPDGKRIVSGSADKTVQVWDAVDGSNIFTYKGHSDQVWSVAWSPDGKRIASASWDQTVQVWNAADGSNAFTYQGHSAGIWSVAWSPNGKHIASGSDDKTVQIWNATNSSHYTYKGHSNTVRSVAWSPDGKHIASASDDKTVQIWDANDSSHVFTYNGHSNTVVSSAWSPDGKCIASGSWDKTVQVWVAS